MNARKPRLHWIKKVLADFEDPDEAADQAPLTVVAECKLVSFVRPTIDNQRNAFDGEDPLLCPSWQLMRLTAASKT